MQRRGILWTSPVNLRGSDDLDCLQGLQYTHCPNNRSQYTPVRTTDHTIGRWWFREHTPIARPSSLVTGRSGRIVQHHQLSLGAQGGRRDQWFPKKHCSVRDQITRRRVISAVENKIIALEDRWCCLRREVCSMGNIRGMRIQAGECHKKSSARRSKLLYRSTHSFKDSIALSTLYFPTFFVRCRTWR